MKGTDLIDALKRKLNVTSNLELAKRLGVSGPVVTLWSQRKKITPRIIAGIVTSAARASMRSIRPLVEFFPLHPVRSPRSATWELFAIRDAKGEAHSYLQGLRTELEEHRGVYVFFDSRGRALYVGKARRQPLWNEMRNAFNRDREVQKVRRTSHPERRFEYRSSNETERRIAPVSVSLHALARYVSAYDVHDDMIDDLEAMLVRSFANDLLNVKMERFSRQRAQAKRPAKPTRARKRASPKARKPVRRRAA